MLPEIPELTWKELGNVNTCISSSWSSWTGLRKVRGWFVQIQSKLSLFQSLKEVKVGVHPLKELKYEISIHWRCMQLDNVFGKEPCSELKLRSMIPSTSSLMEKCYEKDSMCVIRRGYPEGHLPTLILGTYGNLTFSVFSAPNTIPRAYVLWVVCVPVGQRYSWIKFYGLSEGQKASMFPWIREWHGFLQGRSFRTNSRWRELASKRSCGKMKGSYTCVQYLEGSNRECCVGRKT